MTYKVDPKTNIVSAEFTIGQDNYRVMVNSSIGFYLEPRIPGRAVPSRYPNITIEVVRNGVTTTTRDNATSERDGVSMGLDGRVDDTLYMTPPALKVSMEETQRIHEERVRAIADKYGIQRSQ